MLGFLIGNAQQNRQQFGPNSTRVPVQLYLDNHPGQNISFDANRNKIRKTDYHPEYPSEIDLNRYAIRKTDNYPEYPSEIDVNRYTIRKTY